MSALGYESAVMAPVCTYLPLDAHQMNPHGGVQNAMQALLKQRHGTARDFTVWAAAKIDI